MGLLETSAAALIAAATFWTNGDQQTVVEPLQPQTSPLNIQARFFDDRAGAFSENVLAAGKPYKPWNLGVRAAPERQGLWGAGDLLITVQVDTSKFMGPGAQKVSAKVTAKGKVLASRTVRFSRNSGLQHFPVMLQDANCAGVIEVSASMGQLRRLASLDLACGE